MIFDNGFQACLMAPIEILATQHYESLSEMGKRIGIRIELLTGSILQIYNVKLLTPRLKSASRRSKCSAVDCGR